jgi:hypothetical protein
MALLMSKVTPPECRMFLLNGMNFPIMSSVRNFVVAATTKEGNDNRSE